MMAHVADPCWACAQTVHLLFQHLDEGREEAAAALFTEGGIWFRRGEALTGRDTILQAMRDRPKTRVSRHLVTNMVVDAEASAMIARYYVTIHAYDGPPLPVPPVDLPVMILVCEDRLIETAAGWNFVSRSSRVAFARG